MKIQNSKFKISKAAIFIFTVCFLSFGAFSTINASMSSPNYQIESDSINIGGLDVSTSTNYSLKDTIGEVATGNSTSTSYNLYAGYRQMDETYLSISGGSPVNLAPNIGGVTGGTATGSTAFTIITDSPAGYTLSIKADTDPTLKSGSYSFTDYTPASAGTPDYSWLISTSDSEFGFSSEGTDIPQKFKDDGGDCNTGSGDIADKCWYGLSTSDESVANSNSSNHPSGTETTVKLQAESGSSHLQEAGDYTATITATATTN